MAQEHARSGRTMVHGLPSGTYVSKSIPERGMAAVRGAEPHIGSLSILKRAY
jgi:hypothetical protein